MIDFKTVAIKALEEYMKGTVGVVRATVMDCITVIKQTIAYQSAEGEIWLEQDEDGNFHGRPIYCQICLETEEDFQYIKKATEAYARNRWIPVEERLPEMRKITKCLDDEILEYEISNDYLCRTASGEYWVCALYRDEYTEKLWSREDGLVVAVTHWMPLPEPPMEGSK